MNLAFLPFARPDIGDAEIAAVTEALRSGWVTTGPRAREFEQAFTDYLGGGLESIAVNSATAGLHLALEALGIGPGDEVIAPTLTFTATVEVVRYLGADYVVDNGKLKAAGIKFVPADKEAFFKATQPVRDKYGAKYAGLIQRIRDTK